MTASPIPQHPAIQNSFKFLTTAQLKQTIEKRIGQYHEIKELRAKVQSAFDECMEKIEFVCTDNGINVSAFYSGDKEKLTACYGSKLNAFKQDTLNLAEMIGYHPPERDYRSVEPYPTTLELWQQALNAESPSFEEMVESFRFSGYMDDFFKTNSQFNEVSQIYIETAHYYALKFLIQALLSLSFKSQGIDLIAVPSTNGVYSKADDTIVTDTFAIKYAAELDEDDFMDERTMITLKFTDKVLLDKINKALPQPATTEKSGFPSFDD